MILEHLVEHIRDPKEPIDPRDYKQAIKVIDTIRQIKGGSILNGKSYIIQSILFNKRLWNEAKAIKWLNTHKYSGITADDNGPSIKWNDKYNHNDIYIDEKDNFLRFRQFNPEYVKRNNFKEFRTKKLPGGIDIILAYKKNKKSKE